MAKFRARARTLDMLGKQQIAGIPNALHELFKNAYDAYADNISVDFYRRPQILLIRDDGVGMSREDFESRWLTLGTESKLSEPTTALPPVRKGRPERPTMGEKGIGRLAIATIGKIVLVVTRPEVEASSNEKITLCLIHWGLFEIPAVDLNEINLPLRTVDDIDQVSSDLIHDMKNELVESTKGLAENLTALPYTAEIENDFKNWSLPIERLQSLDYGPNLRSQRSGTHFVVHPVAEELTDDIDTRDRRTNSTGQATSLEKMLLGFSNELTNSEPAALNANFRDHLEDGQVLERIASQEFFTKNEFEISDHKVKGKFDPFGNFSGEISIYGGEYKPLKIHLYTKGLKRECGQFDVSFAYVQGSKRDTKLPSDLWEPLTAKLDKIGGLYIYRNGIRVLPFGNSDVDFLEIERRRTLSASYYYFSYRRMFGAIDITAAQNANLKDKAGREGFQSNKAYRQFREQLMRFFEELAARHFREDGAYAEEFIAERDALQKEHKLAQNRAISSKKKREKFTALLESYFDRTDKLHHVTQFSNIVDIAEAGVAALVENSDLDSAAESILSIEKKLFIDLQESLQKFKVSRPNGVGLTKALAKQWEQYQRSYATDVVPQFENARERAVSSIGKMAEEAKVHLDARQRLRSSLLAAEEFSEKSFTAKRKKAEAALKDTSEYVSSQLTLAKRTLQETKDELYGALADFSFDTATEQDVENFQSELETSLIDARRDFEKHLASISTQLNRVREAETGLLAFSDETVAALETELEVLKEDYTHTLDLAQLGMAVSIVQHEFEGNVRGVRRSLQSMKRWADKNEALKGIYNDIRDGFDHLDNYLSLFTPLDRRLRRRKTKITGTQIYEFIDDLFGERFERHEVSFEISEGAAEHSLESYASVVLPVFVNLVDNAVHWLAKKDGTRNIRIDAVGESFVLSDDGPGISALDRDLIFEFGYSKKFGGQGMGLYIAKTSLNKDQLDINLIKENRVGAHFLIGPLEA